ncbi:MAG: hypothetical protein LQ340_003423 [Diploschistes diacapsis]|nr:MAG: hypothetical protein LQ340_003423 [Diploschistes diacapsis]
MVVTDALQAEIGRLPSARTRGILSGGEAAHRWIVLDRDRTSSSRDNQGIGASRENDWRSENVPHQAPGADIEMPARSESCCPLANREPLAVSLRAEYERYQ